MKSQARELRRKEARGPKKKGNINCNKHHKMLTHEVMKKKQVT